jgi:hypothetical protein
LTVTVSLTAARSDSVNASEDNSVIGNVKTNNFGDNLIIPIIATRNIKDFKRSQLKFPQLEILQPEEVLNY